MKRIPLKRALKIALVALVLTTIIGLAESAQLRWGSVMFALENPDREPVPWLRALAATMPFWYVLLALIPLILFMARRYPLESLRRPGALLLHFTAAIVFGLAHITVASWLSDFVLFDDMRISFVANMWRLVSLYFVFEITLYWGIVGGYFAFDYSRRYREKERAAAELELKASRLEASLTRANLEALRMQLNPHFLFNTLNTVSVLALKGERQRVTRMLSRLSDLLRLSLENDRHTVSLREELEFLERFLEIEQVRFRDRLTVEISVDDEAYEAEVPSLILQPVVENALKYGFSQMTGPGKVEIICRVRDDMLELDVCDTGPGFPDGKTANGTGVGLANTRARLQQMYGSNFALETSNRPNGGAIVRIRIPYVQTELPGSSDMQRAAGGNNA